jgi:hypothetical protein
MQRNKEGQITGFDPGDIIEMEDDRFVLASATVDTLNLALELLEIGPADILEDHPVSLRPQGEGNSRLVPVADVLRATGAIPPVSSSE